jgi:hypothetical protein
VEDRLPAVRLPGRPEDELGLSGGPRHSVEQILRRLDHCARGIATQVARLEHAQRVG